VLLNFITEVSLFFIATLKKELMHESRELILKYGAALKCRYKREMEFLLISMDDFQKKLEMEIETIDDVRNVMETLKRFRECEVTKLNI